MCLTISSAKSRKDVAMNDTAMTRYAPAPIVPIQADSDERLIELWLHGRPATTQAAYRRDYAAFQRAVSLPIRTITLGDMQRYMDEIAHLAPATQARYMNTIKSLFTFAREMGYLPLDVAHVVKTPRVKNMLGERIIGEPDVQRLIALEGDPRNHAMLRLLYAGGIRAAELCGLCWRDLQPREQGGQITVFGKGGKTRHIVISATTWGCVSALRGDAGPDDAVFRSSRARGPLTPCQVWRIVKKAAERAGLGTAVSPHFLRHAHASHSLDHGAQPHLVQQTLGHASLTTTSRYTHARPGESSGRYLAV